MLAVNPKINKNSSVLLWDKEGYVRNTTILNKTEDMRILSFLLTISKRRQKKGLTGYERPYLDELLRTIQDEDMLIEVLDEDRFRLGQGGINRCKEMYPAMS